MKFTTKESKDKAVSIASYPDGRVSLYVSESCIGYFKDNKLQLYKDRLIEENVELEIED